MRPPVTRLHPTAHRRQRGVTLVIVLMLLVIVTLLGVGAARIALQGERTTRNERDYQIAWQAAEAALMDAQFDIRGPNADAKQRVALFTPDDISKFVPGCNTSADFRGLCWPSEGKPVWAQVDFLDDGADAPTVAYGSFTGRAFDSGATGVKPARAPRYMIEVVRDQTPTGSAASNNTTRPAPIMYRITAMGFGPREDVQVVLQIAFKKE